MKEIRGTWKRGRGEVNERKRRKTGEGGLKRIGGYGERGARRK